MTSAIDPPPRTTCKNPASADSQSHHTSHFPGPLSHTWWAQSWWVCAIDQALYFFHAADQYSVVARCSQVRKGTRSADLPPEHSLLFLFLLLFCNATHYPKAFAVPALPWEQKEKLQLHCSIKNLFITRWISHTKNIECLWCCYRPWTASCQAACAIFLSCWQPFLCNASFLLVQPLTGRHPAAPVLDKVKTRVGVDWLVDPYLIKDSISLSLSVCRRGPASSCFLCLLNQNLPPWESCQAACCWVTK